MKMVWHHDNENSIANFEFSCYLEIVFISRQQVLQNVTNRLRDFPAIALIGPRQCGKTTLVKEILRKTKKKKIHYFDLEDPADLAQFENPMLALDSLSGLIIIDEIQRRPELFPILRVLIDKNPNQKFLVLGSASRDLLAQSSETLAGRISYCELGGFHLNEVSEKNLKKLWLRGGFPRSYLAQTLTSSVRWRQDFIATFLERDLPNLGIKIPSNTLRRFWTMLAHYHGQIVNFSELGRSLGASDNTIRHYLDILSDTFMIRLLKPWFYNTKKRLVKSPKIYFRDPGILHTLLSIQTAQDLRRHPKLGASWEGFALEETISYLQLTSEEVYFWGIHSGAELDLLFLKKGHFYGIECKYQDAPRLTPSMHAALEELKLKHLWVVYAGKKTYQLHKKISVLPLKEISKIFSF